MPQLGDEHVQASGVEEAVVAPKVEQQVLGVDYPVAVLAKAFQDFRFAVREFHLPVGMGRGWGARESEALRDGVEVVVAMRTGGSVSKRKGTGIMMDFGHGLHQINKEETV